MNATSGFPGRVLGWTGKHRTSCCKLPTAGQPVAVWERAWDRFTPFLAFPPELRKIIYTTNAIESFNYQIRKIIRTADTSRPTTRWSS